MSGKCNFHFYPTVNLLFSIYNTYRLEGYHDNDGKLFCCSETGEPYGPIFTTGDTIGCCLNFINNTVFYTKNGVHLGNYYTNTNF